MEDQITNAEIAMHVGGAFDYPRNPITGYKIFLRGQYLEWVKTEKEVEEFIAYDIEVSEDEPTKRSDYTFKPEYLY